MELICSDTNVWLDFAEVGRLELPFKLPCTYIMSEDAVNELRYPTEIKDKLLGLGLVSVEITYDEFLLSEEYKQYKRLSIPDLIALAMAKLRNIPLMTGDKGLRKAAEKEGVAVIGTIGILDRLYNEGRITSVMYKSVLREFSRRNGNSVRLPQDEIDKRLR